MANQSLQDNSLIESEAGPFIAPIQITSADRAAVLNACHLGSEKPCHQEQGAKHMVRVVEPLTLARSSR